LASRRRLSPAHRPARSACAAALFSAGGRALINKQVHTEVSNIANLPDAMSS
jgi:hypothetical protein